MHVVEQTPGFAKMSEVDPIRPSARAAAHIFIVEDEPDLVTSLAVNFEREGWSSQAVGDVQGALDQLSGGALPDLVLLDLMLPDGSGTEVCRYLRGRDLTRHLPIVIMTAKDEETDRVVGFELGADDYVLKPFSTRELVLRLKAVLRRSRPSDPRGDEFTFGCLRVDRVGYRAWVHESEIQLTALEIRLLTTLIDRRGRVQTRAALLNDVWGQGSPSATTRTVDTHIQRLRRKIGAAAPYIETLRGVGYRFRAKPGA